MIKYALIVAGGKGLRMGSELPKQFLPLGDGKPVLVRTLELFYKYDPNIRIIVVLPREQQEYWKKLSETHIPHITHIVADGGKTRFHSVQNGLQHVGNKGVVGVHDGVRPFVALEVITQCYKIAKVHRAVVPVIKVHETLRRLTESGSKTVGRENYRLVQTPQVFEAALLKKAYEQEFDAAFTDDASVVEAFGVPACLIEGNRENIKITTPFDLKIANALL